MRQVKRTVKKSIEVGIVEARMVRRSAGANFVGPSFDPILLRALQGPPPSSLIAFTRIM